MMYYLIIIIVYNDITIFTTLCSIFLGLYWRKCCIFLCEHIEKYFTLYRQTYTYYF